MIYIMMKRSQIYLSVDQWRRLSALSLQFREPVSELIRKAIDRVYQGAGAPSLRESLRQAAGIWKDRRDLPPTRAYIRRLRRDRRLERLYRKKNG